MTDALLFLHLLSAAALFAAVASFSAIVLGARAEAGVAGPAVWLWRIGMLGVIVFGIALSIDIDGYQPWDGWILIAVALWLVAGGIGDRVAAACQQAAGAGGTLPGAVARSHWITVTLVVLLLADMVWKPWA